MVAAEDDIATIMTMESGKPLKESKGEFTSGCALLQPFVCALQHAPLHHPPLSALNERVLLAAQQAATCCLIGIFCKPFLACSLVLSKSSIRKDCGWVRSMSDDRGLRKMWPDDI